MTDHVPKANLTVAAICLPATALILWLATSFWLDARHQKVDATNILATNQLERSLMRASTVLANERSVILGSNSTTAVALQLDARQQATTQNTELLTQTLKAIEATIETQKLGARLRYTQSAVSTLIADIRRAQDELQTLRLAVKRSITNPDVEANNFKEQFFDDTSHLINQIHKLQSGIHYQPRIEIGRISRLRAFCNGIRDLGEKIAAEHASQLIRLHNQKTNRSRLSSKWEVTWQQVQQQLISLQEFRDLQNTDHHLLAQLDALTENWISARSEQTIAIAGTATLLKSNDEFQKQIQTILETGVARLEEHARDSESQGIRRLIIDTALLFIALWIVFASVRLVIKINHQAYHDRLTNLPNRFRFNQLLTNAINLQPVKFGTLSVAVLDIDNFKLINNSLGYPMGNQVLKALAERLSLRLGSQGIIALLSADEFGIITDGRSDSESTEQLISELITVCSEPFNISGLSINITVSAGLCHFDEKVHTADLITEHADVAMRRAKDNGKNTVTVFDPDLGKKYRARIALEIDLRKAADENQLLLYYQPKVNTITGEVDGAEALVRWQHPKQGMVSPFQFIDIAEQSGQIVKIGTWVLNEACRQAAEWRAQGIELQIAINVSAQQFAQNDFVETVQRALQNCHLDASSIELEVTESVGVKGMETMVKRLNDLRQLGISIAIDDFGTGYSSLQYLEDLPLDKLKIDRAFIQKIDAESASDSLVNAVTSLAKTYKLKTVAEGVETEQQYAKVLKLGCHYIQGYYYSKPVAADKLPAVIENIAAMHKPCQHKAA